MNELIFLVEDADEGGYTARALGESIFTEAETLPDLRAMIRDAVQCHFEEARLRGLRRVKSGRVKQTIAVLLLLIVTVLVPVQIGRASVTKKPNLTGNWKLDMDASSFTLSKRDLVFDGIVLEIDHQEPELKIMRKVSKNNSERVQKLLYHCEGKGEVNLAPAGSTTIKSRTLWNGDVLVTTSTGSHGPYTTESCQVLELSPDGQTLTQYSLPNIPEFGVFVQNSPELLGRLKTKRIYRKIA